MSEPLTFDCANADSKFLSFVAAETHRRGTPLRLTLSRKIFAKAIVADFGVPVARQWALLKDIVQFPHIELPDSFAFKFAHGYSGKGIMLLTKLGIGTGKAGEYFCLLNQRALTAKAIIELQLAVAAGYPNRPKEWIVEEIVESTIYGKPVPLDYKFYCFQGEVGMIVQADRNIQPSRVCLLGPDFAPLRHGTDYLLNRGRLGVPIVPWHAQQLLDLARSLSTKTDSPFVSVDLYDSPSGPVFGEFTFSPGGTFTRMWFYERNFLRTLDAIFEKAEARLAHGTPPLPWEYVPNTVAAVPAETYAILAGLAIQGSVRAASTLQRLYEGASPSIAFAWESIVTTIEDQIKQETTFHSSLRAKSRKTSV